MRRNLYRIAVQTAACAVVLIGGARYAAAEVSVNINIGPPPIAVAEPPAVVLVPGSSVYFVPGVSFDVFYYGGYWWSPRGDRWYRSRAYDGPWNTVSRRVVPAPVYRVPHNYRDVYAHERHIPYGQWKKEHYRRGGHDRGEAKGHGHGGGKEHGHGGGKEHGHGGGGGGGHGHGHGHDEDGDHGHGHGHGHGRD